MSGGIVGVGAPDPGTAQLINRLANPPNPLEQAGQTINALTGIRNYQAQQASADAYRQSVNPLTGEVDLGRYKALLSQGPGAFNFGPLVTSGGQAVGAVGQGTSADVKAKVDQLNATGALMYPLLKQAASGPVDPKEVQGTLDQAHSMGLVTDQQYQQWTGALSGMTPDQARGWVLGANMGNGEALRLLTGQIAPTQTGPSVAFPQVSPLGAPSPQGPIAVGLTPDGMVKLTSYLNEPFSYTDKQGRVHPYPTKLAFYNELGINPFKMFTDGTIPAPGTAPPVLPMTAPGSTGPVSTVTTGRTPVAPAAPAAPGLPGGLGGGPAAPAAPAAAPGGGGGGGGGGGPAAPAPPPATAPAPPAPQPQTGGNLESPTSPSAALPENIVAAGRKAYDLAQTNQQNLPLQLQPLHNAMALLRTNPDLQTGAGQAQWAHAITSIAAALNINVPQGSSDLQELTKYLVQNVRAQETGGSTDLDRLQTEAANPNPTTQSRDALQVLLAKQIGVTRLQSAALDYFNSKYPDAQTAAINSGRFNIDTTDWKKKQDPTAWAADDLAPEQVARYFQGLNGSYDSKTGTATGDKAAFINSLRDARQIGKVTAGATTGPASEPPPLPAGVP